MFLSKFLSISPKKVSQQPLNEADFLAGGLNIVNTCIGIDDRTDWIRVCLPRKERKLHFQPAILFFDFIDNIFKIIMFSSIIKYRASKVFQRNIFMF